MVITLAVSSLILLTVGLIKDGKCLKTVFKNGFFYAAGGGVANGVTNFLSLLVYTLVPISFAAPVKTGISIVIAFLIAVLIFKEKYTFRQYCGVILGCIALVLFNI
jgi:glucose uptake protein GlcU